MKILIIILFSLLLGVVFFALGNLIGNGVAKKQKMQDEVLKNGSKHV